MTEAAKKNPHPLVVKGVFYVTADFDDKQYVVSNGLSFIRFKTESDDIAKGDYVYINGPVYQRKEARNAIITGEAEVKKLSEKEVEVYKSEVTKTIADNSKDKPKKSTTKKSTTTNKMPWE